MRINPECDESRVGAALRRAGRFVRIVSCLGVLALLSAFSSAVQLATDGDSSATRPAAATQPAAAATDATRRLVLVGASATYGYGVSMRVEMPPLDAEGKIKPTVSVALNLGDVMECTLITPHDKIQTQADLLFFMNSMDIGPKLLQRAKGRKPTAIIGLDFLFWFGYGDANRNYQPIASEDQRLELLEEGLKLLEPLECPIVVGDFPDMSAAVGGMLTPQQMPKPETLVRLNARLREWAKGHPNVAIAPLADLIERMRKNEAFSIGQARWPAGSASLLLQPDQLHPTAEGLVALGQMVAESLRSLGDAPPESFDHDPAHVLAALRKLAADRAAPPATRPDAMSNKKTKTP